MIGDYILKLMKRILDWAQKSHNVDYKSYKEMKDIYESTKPKDKP